MPPKNDRSAFRITALLYLGLLILPLAFFFGFRELGRLGNDTQIIRQLAREGGEMASLPLLRSSQERERTVRQIDKALAQLEPWFRANDDNPYYVGPRSPLRDFQKLQNCWRSLKRSSDQQKALECWKQTKVLTFATERMINVEIERLRNTLYMTLAGAMLLLLLLIVFVRAYIEQQLRKQAVVDPESGLFNRKYCAVSLHKHCARAQRLGHALSLLDIRIDGLDPKWKKEEKRRFMNQLGQTMHELFRTSDTLCRYDEHGFVAIMPDTPPEGAQIVESRIREKLTAAMQKHYPSFQSSVEILTSPEKGECETFLKRKLGLEEEKAE